MTTPGDFPAFPCRHETLHFEGKRIAWLVCTCGKRWERCVEYSQSCRYTFYRSEKSKMVEEIEKIIETHIGDFREDLLYRNLKHECAVAIHAAYERKRKGK